jgi:hypothetical protein
MTRFGWKQCAAACILGLILCSGPVLAQVGVLTQRYNNQRTGANMSETTLTTSNVNVNTFGHLFNMPVDGFVYAQPLYVPNVAVSGQGTHNVLYVATAHDTVYAFDADTGKQLLFTSLGTPVPSSVIGTVNIQVEVGIISTPVIDPNTNTLYVVTKNYNNSTQLFSIHALDITTLAEKSYSPQVISASVPGTGVEENGAGNVVFTASQENQRSALTLVNGVIYMAFASHEDYDPYHGWVLAYNESTLAQVAAFNDTPNGGEGGIWMGGQGVVADSSNNVYLLTGNSTQSTENKSADFGESFVKLGLSGTNLLETDYFKPNNYDTLNSGDIDLGSGGPVAIPGTTYIVGGGKQGILYLVDTTNMGGLNLSTDQCRQEFQAENGIWGSPVYWNNPTNPLLYVWGNQDNLKAYSFNSSAGLFNTTPALVSGVSTPGGGDTCGAVSVSSNGTTAGTGILWATIPLADPDHATVPGELYAFDATTFNELYNSYQVQSRDDFGNFAKFVSPLDINGKVYVCTDSGQISVYGLLPPPTNVPPAPTITTVTAGNATVNLVWKASATATSYTVLRATSLSGPFLPISSLLLTLSYSDSGLTNGQTYYYEVEGYNALGPSLPSNIGVATPKSSAGTLIGINFVGGGSSLQPPNMGPSEVAGVIPTINWNNAAGSSSTLGDLLDVSGADTGAQVTWSATDTWSLPIADMPGNTRMMEGYLDTVGSGVTVTVSNLPASITASPYDVYVYSDGDNSDNSRTGLYTIGSTTIGATDSPGTNFSGTFTQANNSAGNYVVFPNVTGSSFALTSTPGPASDNTPRAPVNGIEIVEHSVAGTTVTMSPHPASVGQSVTFTASVNSSNSVSPSGTVLFTLDNVVQGSAATISGGTAILTVTSLSVGSHTITAAYSGDNVNLASTGSLVFSVGKAATNTALKLSSNGPSVSIGATVTGTQGVPLTGSVALSLDGNLLVAGPVNPVGTVGPFSYRIPAGSHVFTATYSGDANNLGSTQTLSSQVVNAATSTTTVTTSHTPSISGQSLVFTAHVVGSSPTGSVQFAVDHVIAGNPVALGNGGTATFSTSALTVAKHTITATYSGDAYNTSSTGSVAQTVYYATPTIIASGLSPSSAPVNTAVSPLAIAGTGFVAGATSVNFGAHLVSANSVVGSSKSLTVDIPAADLPSSGNVSVSVSVHQPDSSLSTSNAVSFNVFVPVVLSVSPNRIPTVGGSTKPVPEAISVNGSGFVPASTVSWHSGLFSAASGDLTYVGPTQLKISSIPASLVGLPLFSGPVTVANPGGGGSSASGAASVLTTIKAPTTTSMKLAASGPVITFSATVAGTSGLAPTGTVQLIADGGAIRYGLLAVNASGSVGPVSYRASAGTHVFVAVYAGDASNAISTSGSVTLTITAAKSSTSLSSSKTPSSAGQSVLFTAKVSGSSPTGTIQFAVDGANVGAPVTMVNAAATFTISTLPAGKHVITATYSGDHYNTTSSGAVTQTVAVG